MCRFSILQNCAKQHLRMEHSRITLENRLNGHWPAMSSLLTLLGQLDSKNNLLIAPSGKDKALTTPLGGK